LADAPSSDGVKTRKGEVSRALPLAPLFDKCKTTSCGVALPAADDFDLTSFAIGGAFVNIPCPDAGNCELPARDELTEVVMAVGFGPNGTHNGAEVCPQFSLVLTSGARTSTDAVTFDPRVAGACGNLKAAAPEASVVANIYFERPRVRG
jgi:hypothetical protein